MSYTNTTPHYNLPQYIGTDKPTMLGDFNSAMEVIDAQMYKNSQSAQESVASVAGLQTKVDTLTTSVTNANANVSQLEQQSTTLENNVQTVSTNANSALSDAQSAQQAANNANTTATSASTTASQAASQSSANAASIQELDARVTALEGGNTGSGKCTFKIKATQSGSASATGGPSNVQVNGSVSGTTNITLEVDFTNQTVTMTQHSQSGTITATAVGIANGSGNVSGTQTVSDIVWT